MKHKDKQIIAQKNKSFFNQYAWLIVSSVTLVTVAILAEKYFRENSDYKKNNTDDLLLENCGHISNFCEKNLEDLRQQTLTISWERHYEFDFDLRIQDDHEYIQSELTKCRKAFSKLIEGDSFFPNLLLTTKLAIVLVPESIFGSGYGLYDPTTFSIGLIYKRNTTIEQYRRYLANEFYSHQVHMINLRNGIKADSTLICCPVLNQNGTVSTALLERQEKALDIGIKRVIKCRQYFSDYVNNYREGDCCNELLNYAQQYTPNIYYLTEEQYQESLAAGVTTPLDASGKFQSGKNHPDYLSKCYGRKHNNQFKYSYAKDKTALSKVIALLGDIFGQYLTMYNPQGPYYELSRERKASELASFVAEYPKKIQQFLFPEFYNATCEFFTSHHNQPEYLPKEISEKQHSKIPSLKDKKELLFFPDKDTQEKTQPSKQKHTATRLPNTSRKTHFGTR